MTPHSEERASERAAGGIERADGQHEPLAIVPPLDALAFGPPEHIHRASPATKPATCAQNAMPPDMPASGDSAAEPRPLRNCSRNHSPRNITAGTSTSWMKKKIGISVTIRECGYITK